MAPRGEGCWAASEGAAPEGGPDSQQGDFGDGAWKLRTSISEGRPPLDAACPALPTGRVGGVGAFSTEARGRVNECKPSKKKIFIKSKQKLQELGRRRRGRKTKAAKLGGGLRAWAQGGGAAALQGGCWGGGVQTPQIWRSGPSLPLPSPPGAAPPPSGVRGWGGSPPTSPPSSPRGRRARHRARRGAAAAPARQPMAPAALRLPAPPQPPPPPPPPGH